MLQKIKLFSICSPFIDWIADISIGRVMRVSRIRSSFIDVRSGVPQESVICPLLFLLF